MGVLTAALKLFHMCHQETYFGGTSKVGQGSSEFLGAVWVGQGVTPEIASGLRHEMVSNLQVSGEMVPRTWLMPNSLAVLMVFGAGCFGPRGFSTGKESVPHHPHPLAHSHLGRMARHFVGSKTVPAQQNSNTESNLPYEQLKTAACLFA